MAIVLVTVRVILVPDTLTAVTAFEALPTKTEKSLFAGDPVTVSLVVSVIVFVPAFAAYALIVGRTPSITMALLSAREFVVPAAVGSFNVSVAERPAKSLIVPLFSASDVVPL